MAMSQSEYLSRLTFESKKYISRNKVRDSSEQTFITQARSSGNVHPTSVQFVGNTNNVSTIMTMRGSGTNMSYTNILQGAQKCAVCSDPDPAVAASITLPCNTTDHMQPPWAQQPTSNVYVNCTVPPNQYFFPVLPSFCSTNMIKYSFPSG
jgi:hypothetical protein